MNIFFNSRINANQSLLNVLFGQQQKAASSQNTGCRGTRDTLTISASGKEKLTKSTSGRTHNTSIDSSIDLKSYIASAKKTNQEIIENAGTQINAKTSEYMSTGKAFRAALTEKYSKLAAEAKTHSNPENYIHSKYFDKSSEYYETNLTDTERRIAYNYEMQMCRTGKINGVNYQDSLFRGIEVDGDSVDSDKIQFERALVNSQISNILKQAGVDTSSITEDCIFTVDPYSYEITVDGVDEETKVLMQNALNVGNNGKNLYKHIYYCSTQDGCESSQVTEESKMKYEAYHQVYSYTGYGLDKLEEKNGTYYTESGENILDLVDSAVESSGKVPKEFNQQMKNWIHDLVSTISTRGWNNVPDMTLSIIYGKSSLKDMNQLITYQYEADRMNRQWYSVAGMDVTGKGTSWQQLTSVSEEYRQKMFDNVKREFIQENGLSNGDTTKRSDIFKDYQLSVSKDKRLSGTWTLEQYEGQYRAAMYAAVKSANPNWKPGQKFDTSILDNVKRESVESTLVKNGNRLVRNSIDVSV